MEISVSRETFKEVPFPGLSKTVTLYM